MQNKHKPNREYKLRLNLKSQQYLGSKAEATQATSKSGKTFFEQEPKVGDSKVLAEASIESSISNSNLEDKILEKGKDWQKSAHPTIS